MVQGQIETFRTLAVLDLNTIAERGISGKQVSDSVFKFVSMKFKEKERLPGKTKLSKLGRIWVTSSSNCG